MPNFVVDRCDEICCLNHRAEIIIPNKPMIRSRTYGSLNVHRVITTEDRKYKFPEWCPLPRIQETK